MEKILGKQIWARIPSDYFLAVNALNKGLPFVISAPKSKMSLAIDEIAEKIMTGRDTPASPLSGRPASKKGFFRRAGRGK